MLISIFIYLSLIFLFWCYIWNRNNRVHDERIRVIYLVHELNILDIDNGVFSDNWRTKSFDTITYSEMVYKIWKPVKSFYKNHPCLKEYDTRNLKVIED